MSGKAKTRKTFGSKLKDQQGDNKTFYNLANQGTIMSSSNSVVTGGSVGGGTVNTFAESDLQMNTYDIVGVDRFKFAVREGAGNALTSDDYGIEAIYTGNTAYGMQMKIPTGKLLWFVSGSEYFTFGNGAGIYTTELIGGGSLNTASYLDIANIASPANPSATRVRLFADEDNSDHLTVRRSDGSEVDLESGGWVGTATSDLDMGTYDIVDICRLEFDPAGSALNDSVTGIDATSTELHFNVPTGDSFKFTIQGVEQFWVGVNQVSFASNELLALGNIDSDLKLDDGHNIRCNDALGKINIHVSDSTNSGTSGSVGVPYVYASSYPSNANLDTWFGSDSGNIGVFRHTTSTDRFYFNTADGWNYINSEGTA